MASWDNASLPGAPAAPPYASPLLDFSALARLPDQFFKGRENQFAEQQRQRELDLQKPIDSSDPNAVVAELMRRGGAPYAERLIPFLQQQQAGQPSPLFGGGGGGQPSPQGAGVASAAPVAAGGVAPIPAAAAPQPRPTGGYTGGDSGQGTVASIVTSKLPENSAKTGVIMANVAKIVGADPNAPLTAEQQDRVTRLVDAYTARTGAAPNGAEPVPMAAPVAAPGAAPAPSVAAAPAAAAAQPQVILPPGFDDPKKAIVALRREAVRYGANPAGKEQAAELSGWANRIEAAVSGPQQFGVIGHDENGLAQYGFINPYTQSVKTAAGAPAAPAGTAQLTGQPYLDTIDPGRAAQIKAMVEGRMAPPTGMALKSPQIQALMRQAAQYEPGFDFTMWGKRAATAKDFGSGKASQNVTAFNTAISHLDTLDKAAEGLGNRWSPQWNTVANMVTTATGDPRVKKFEIARTAVADELTRAFRGSGGNVHDIIQWEKAINSSGSPEQLKSAIKQAVELLRGRIESLGDQYNRGMGTSRAAPELLSPKAQESLARLSGEPAPAAAPAEKAAGAALPKFNSPADVQTAIKDRKLKSGDQFLDANGVTRVVP